jgi:hypothetical protein
MHGLGTSMGRERGVVLAGTVCSGVVLNARLISDCHEESVIGAHVVQGAGVPNLPDLILLEDIGHQGHVIIVGVAQNDVIDCRDARSNRFDIRNHPVLVTGGLIVIRARIVNYCEVGAANKNS